MAALFFSSLAGGSVVVNGGGFGRGNGASYLDLGMGEMDGGTAGMLCFLGPSGLGLVAVVCAKSAEKVLGFGFGAFGNVCSRLEDSGNKVKLM